jgi:signal transduction histidine kinase
MKHKRIFLKILLLVLLVVSGLYVQNVMDRRNSPERILDSSEITVHRELRRYDSLCWIYLETDIERAATLARLGLALAQSSDECYFTGKFYSHLGFSHYYSSRYDSAMHCFERMLSVAERMKRENMKQAAEMEADACTNIGITYDVQGKLQETIRNYLKGLEIAERNNLTTTCELLYANLGRAYYCLKNNHKSLYYYTRDIELCSALNDSSKMCYAYLGLSNIYLDRQEYDEAFLYALTAYRLAMNHPNTTVENKIFSLQTLTEIHIKSGTDSNRAIEYAKLALQYSEIWNSPVHIANSLRQMSYAYLQRGEYSLAEQAALRALASDSTDTYANALLYEYIARVNIMTGNSDKATNAFNRQIELNSAYSNKNYQTALSEMEVIYETEKKELQISTLKEEKHLILWLVIAIATVLMFGLTTLFLLWRWTVQKKRLAEQQVAQLEQEKQLVATQAVLDGETHERIRLARDLHDGLGGMLTGIKLNLENVKNGAISSEADMECFKNALGILNESIHELRRVAHHLMPETLSSYGLKPAIGDFCRSLSSDIDFDWFGNDTRLDPKLEVVIYRIIHELVNNSLKYSGASQIMVQVMQDIDRIAFTVQDDGCGFDPSAVTHGMGLSNITTRVASFGGKIQIDSKANEGTETNVEFRILYK